MSKSWNFLFLLTVVLSPGCKGPARPSESPGKGGEKTYRSGTAKRTRVVLADGTEVMMNGGTVLRLAPGFGKTGRELVLEGEALFIVSPGTSRPLVVHTKALVVSVQGVDSISGAVREDSNGKVVGNDPGDGISEPLMSVFKIDGRPESPGEEVDVLRGGLVVKKTYHSTTDNEPEALGPGEMVMINTDIDLMEKEKFDTAELKAWMKVR